MDKYNWLWDQFSDCSPAEKLKILREELLAPIDRVRGTAQALKLLEKTATYDLPEPYAYFVDGLLVAGEELRDILDALTLSKRRAN